MLLIKLIINFILNVQSVLDFWKNSFTLCVNFCTLLKKV